MNNPMKVLMTGYEAAPFFKRGGLGDVLGSLPKALRDIGVDAQVIIPYYQDIENKYKLPKIGEYSIVFGEDIEQVGVYEKDLVYFLSNRKYLSSINTRGRNKKIDQFAFFDLAVVEFSSFILEKKRWYPTLIHCNDWHTGFIPLLIEQRIPTLLTIHNLNYQGWGSRKVLDLLHVKDEKVKELKRGVPVTEINVLGEGILHATAVSTVSPSYAHEITSDYDGDPIHLYLKRREKEGKDHGVKGIINGIDYATWNPKYDTHSWEKGKEKNKELLLKSLGLNSRPTFCFIGRMARQKGLDILVGGIEKILSKNRNNANFILLGSGTAAIEKMVKNVANRYKDNVRVELSYNEEFAHKLYAGADFIIIPSRYEPCGLIQMIAMRYGTLPIAAKTGGLKDTISHGKNGFLFEKESVSGLVEGIKKALAIYQSPGYKKMVKSALQTDFSWQKSAALYKKLYIDIIRE